MSGNESNSYIINVECEFITLLAAMPENVIDVREIITPEDFYSPIIRNAYIFLLKKYDMDGGFIPEDLISFMNSEGGEMWQDVKNSILSIITKSVDGLIARAKQIRSYSLHRQLQMLTQDIMMSTPESIQESIADILKKVSSMTETPKKSSLVSVKDGINEYINKKCSGDTGDIIPSGYTQLDSKLAISRGDLVIIAARPSVGKSAFVSNLSVKFSFKGYKVAFFSLEMPESQVKDRIISCVGQIPFAFLSRNSISGKYIEELSKAYALVFNKCDISINDSSYMTVNEIRRICMTEKPDVVIIDYLQLLSAPRGRKYNNTVDKVSEMTRELKIMAGEINAAVILLSQLNRDVERRGTANALPQLSDLRDSGSIEQDANSVVFLSKLAPNDKNSDIVVDIAKNRSGETGKLIFSYDRSVQTMRETEREYAPPSSRERNY